MTRLTMTSFILVSLAALTASPATAQDARDPAGEPREKEDAIYPDDDSVPSVKCIQPKKIKSTQVLDGRNILFFMRGKKIYRNVLPRKCLDLDRFGTFSYPSTYGRLCDIDRISVIGVPGGLSSGINCRLGKFYPVTEDELDAMAREAELVKELDMEIE